MPLVSDECRISIYPFEKQGVQEVIDPSSDVVSCTVNNNINGDGRYSLSLKPLRVDWVNMIPGGSWIEIEMMDSRSREFKTELVGRVEQIREVRTPNRVGGTNVTHNFSGRNHGWVFKDLDVWPDPFLRERLIQDGMDPELAPFLPVLATSSAIQAALDTFFSGNPIDYINDLILQLCFDAAVFGQQFFVLPAGLRARVERLNWRDEDRGITFNVDGRPTQQPMPPQRAADMIGRDFGPEAVAADRPGVKGVYLDETIVWGQAEGKLWSLLKQHSNPAFNELFFRYNSATRRPEIVLRERPFPCWVVNAERRTVELATSQWEDLRGVMFRETSLGPLRLSKDESERINYFMLYADGTPFYHQDQLLMLGNGFDHGGALLVESSLAQHGLRRLEVTTRYLAYDRDSASEQWARPASFWLSQLWSWYVLNHEYLDGTVTVPFVSRGEVGERLWIQRKDGTFFEGYIEGVTKSIQVGKKGGITGRTVFNVTRGVDRIVGQIERGPLGARLAWNVREDYPLPDAPDDVRALLKFSSELDVTFTDPDEVRSPTRNESFDSNETLHGGPTTLHEEIAIGVIQAASAIIDAPPNDDELDIETEPPTTVQIDNNPLLVATLERLAFFDPGSNTELIPDFENEFTLLARYRIFLASEGVTAFTAEQLTFLRSSGYVHELANTREGWYWRNSEDRTMFVIPPESYWRHIVPACLIAQAIWSENGFSPDDFYLYNGFRPRDYDLVASGRSTSRHSNNHAIDIRPRRSAMESPDSSGRTDFGERFYAAVNAFYEGDPRADEWRVFFNFYHEVEDGRRRRYQLHIDAAFSDDRDTHNRSRRGRGNPVLGTITEPTPEVP